MEQEVREEVEMEVEEVEEVNEVEEITFIISCHLNYENTRFS